MKLFAKVAIIFALVFSVFGGPVLQPAFAAVPVFSVQNQNSNSPTITIDNADPNAQVNLYYRPQGSSQWNSAMNVGRIDYLGYFSQVLTMTGSTNQPVELYVVVNGYQSNAVSVNPGEPICSYQYNYSCTGSNNVYMLETAFSPRIITVPLGSTVIWINNSSMTHTVTADDNSFASGNIPSGSSFSRTFNSSGTFNYHCIFHGNAGSGMSGAVIVNPAAGNALSLSQSAVNIKKGQSESVSIFGGSNYFFSQVPSSSIASASILGDVLTVRGENVGSSGLSVCASSGQCANLPITVSVANAASVYFLTTSLPRAKLNGSYLTQLQMSGGSQPYYFSLYTGSLPQGLYLTSGGQIYGTPQSASASNFQIQARDANNNSAIANFLIIPETQVLGQSVYANGTLLKDGLTVYLVYKNIKTGFSNLAAFRGLGYRLEFAIEADTADIPSSGYVVSTSKVQHPWGSWVSVSRTVYFVHELGLIPVSNPNVFTSNGGDFNLVVPANSFDIRLPRLSPLVENDLRLY